MLLVLLFVFSKGGAAMGKRRNLRTKVRLTEMELSSIRMIAEQLNIPAAALLRDSTLYASNAKRAVVDTSDIREFTTAVSSLDNVICDLLPLMAEKGRVSGDDIGKISTELDCVDALYGSLRKKVLAKRNRLLAAVISILDKEILDDSHYNEPVRKGRKAISVSVSKEELDTIRRLSDEQDCSMSYLLKANVFRIYRTSRIVIDSDSLAEISGSILREVRFLQAVCRDVKGRHMESDDTENVYRILHGIRIDIEKCKAMVNMDAKAIYREAGKLLEKEREAW